MRSIDTDEFFWLDRTRLQADLTRAGFFFQRYPGRLVGDVAPEPGLRRAIR